MNSLKQDFPIFKNNPGLVYLDSAATSLKPKVVIDKITEYYEKYSANIARGVHKLAERATEEFEKTREVVAGFINAKSSQEIIFTRNTTESINLVAYSLGRKIIDRRDQIVTTIMEHHSNFVPWQQLAIESGAAFKVIDIDDEGRLISSSLEKFINNKTKILALTYISNVLGTINPVKEIIKKAKEINPDIIVVVDAAQAASTRKIDVQDLGCDFLAFSSHKMLGPTGVGILWGKKDLLDAMCPFLCGGGMIQNVDIENTSFAEVPNKFEAGTPDIGGVIALKAAIFYIQNVGWEKIHAHEKTLVKYAIESLKNNFQNKINILGPGIGDRGGVVAFSYSNYHPHDIAQILDESNIAVRAGHHCAMLVHKRLNILGSTRTSFYIYNNKRDVDRLVDGLLKVEKVLK